MASLSRAYARFLDFLGLAAGLVLATLALLIAGDVVARNLGLGNLPSLIEVTEYALYIATFAAAPWVLRQGAHVRVDLLVGLLPGPGARALERAADALGLGVSAVLFYFGYAAAADAKHIGSTIFKELVVDEWWLLAVIPASTALLTIEFALRLWHATRRRREA